MDTRTAPCVVTIPHEGADPESVVGVPDPERAVLMLPITPPQYVVLNYAIL